MKPNNDFRQPLDFPIGGGDNAERQPFWREFDLSDWVEVCLAVIVVLLAIVGAISLVEGARP